MKLLLLSSEKTAPSYSESSDGRTASTPRYGSKMVKGQPQHPYLRAYNTIVGS
ncbi:MAG: hypothetical protein ACP5GU_04710 [Thermoprotei archaeon]